MSWFGSVNSWISRDVREFIQAKYVEGRFLPIPGQFPESALPKKKHDDSQKISQPPSSSGSVQISPVESTAKEEDKEKEVTKSSMGALTLSQFRIVNDQEETAEEVMLEPLCRAQALYTYRAEETNELAFEVDDIIDVRWFRLMDLPLPLKWMSLMIRETRCFVWIHLDGGRVI